VFLFEYKTKKRRSGGRHLALIVVLAFSALRAHAHNGPPFPIIENQRVGPAIISVWTNPDVGTGSFFVMVDAPPGGSIPSDLKVDVAVQPLTGRLPEKSYSAWREKLRGQVEYKTLVSFDAQEMWRVKVMLSSAEGSGEATANVQVTPPGLGRWDLLLYLLPFLGAGFLWFKAVARRRKRKPIAVQPS
jgi:hypothetical protein